MKTLIVGLALAVISGTAWAQAGGLINATVEERSSIADPAVAIKAMDSEWLAFSIPAQKGTRSPCCWQGKWNSNREVGCSLQEDHQSFGTRSDSPLAEKLIAYARVSNGEVQDMRVVGDQCPVEGAGARVTWIGETDSEASLNWLQDVSRNGKSGARDTALYAIALHQSPDATERLVKLATESGNGMSQEAIFWLGDARGDEGFKALITLLDDLPHGDKRQEINFALAQNGTPAAIDRLTEISRSDSDPEQRSNALFWLAEEFPEQAEDILLKALATEQDEEVLEQIVFAISQLPDSMSTPLLLELAQDAQQSKAVRRQALFWLAHSDDEQALAALEALLTR
jgi:HEAT repeat protein